MKIRIVLSKRTMWKIKRLDRWLDRKLSGILERTGIVMATSGCTTISYIASAYKAYGIAQYNMAIAGAIITGIGFLLVAVGCKK